MIEAELFCRRVDLSVEVFGDIRISSRDILNVVGYQLRYGTVEVDQP